MDHHIPHVGDPVRVRLPDPETSRRWYPKAFAANGRPGRVMAIRPQDCTRKYIVRFEDGSELELSADALENDYREEAMEYDAKELLYALPLVKDVTPSHLHTYRTRDGLVSVNGDLSAARPVLAHARMDLSGVFIPLGKVRRLLQLWPAGERVEVYVGSYCPLSPKLGRGTGVWERSAARQFVQFVGLRFRCRLDDAERYDYRMSKGDWRWTSREEHVRHAESAAYHEDWSRRSRRSRRFWSMQECEREVLSALVARKLGRAV